jgi:hypothetical protein
VIFPEIKNKNNFETSDDKSGSESNQQLHAIQRNQCNNWKQTRESFSNVTVQQRKTSKNR